MEKYMKKEIIFDTSVWIELIQKQKTWQALLLPLNHHLYQYSFSYFQVLYTKIMKFTHIDLYTIKKGKHTGLPQRVNHRNIT